jgi:hypothetical protein
MKRVDSLCSIVGLLLAASTSLSARAEDRTPAMAAQPAATKQSSPKPRVSFTISKETTYIVQPLDKDGYPDYVEALNLHYGKGVTPENNAAVPYWRAMGPKRIIGPPERHAEFLKLLGIESLPEKGDYFLSDGDYFRQFVAPKKSADIWESPESKTYFNAYRKAHQRPWTKAEFPQVAAWLAANEKPAALFFDAANRPRRFDPLLNGKWGESLDLWNITPFRYAPFNVWSGLRSDTYAPLNLLIARALLRLGEGRIDDAWQDMLACHRWARHCEEGPSLIEYQASPSMERYIWSAELGLLQHTRLSGPQLKRMLADLDRLPKIPDVAERVDIGVRCEYHQLVNWMSRNYLPWTMRSMRLGWLYNFCPVDPGIFCDWDVLFRKGNAAADRVVNVVRHGTLAERRALRREMWDRAWESKKDAKKDIGPGTILNLLNGKLVKQRTRISADLGEALCEMIFRPVCDASDCEDEIRMRFELTKLAFALAAYHADHDAYPAELVNLVPDYVPQIPKDVFSAADLHYSIGDGGYLLYSVGRDRKDDGGRGIDDRPQNIPLPDGTYAQDRFEDWDDIVVRMTTPK